MVSPNWPSDDDPDYTPNFVETSSNLDPDYSKKRDLEELREEIDDLADRE